MEVEKKFIEPISDREKFEINERISKDNVEIARLTLETAKTNLQNVLTTHKFSSNLEFELKTLNSLTKSIHERLNAIDKGLDVLNDAFKNSVFNLDDTNATLDLLHKYLRTRISFVLGICFASVLISIISLFV